MKAFLLVAETFFTCTLTGPSCGCCGTEPTWTGRSALSESSGPEACGRRPGHRWQPPHLPERSGRGWGSRTCSDDPFSG